MPQDSGKRQTVVVVTKYESRQAWLAGQPYEVTKPVGNSFAPRGDQIMWKLFAGAGAGNEFYNGANTWIFVGNSSASVSGSGQPSALQGATQASRPLDSGFPNQFSYGSVTLQYNQIAYQATFDGSTGNGFPWLEMGIVNGSSVAAPTALTVLTSTGTLFNRAIAPDTSNGWGTKVAGTIWVGTMLLTVT